VPIQSINKAGQVHVEGSSYQFSVLEGGSTIPPEYLGDIGDSEVGMESYRAEVDEVATKQDGLGSGLAG
jgi:hypothetical protein